jgi:hypothetical protein
MAELPMFDIQNVDHLRDYAFALGYAHIGNRATAEPVDNIAEQASELSAMRERYIADGRALVKRGLLPTDLVEKHQSGHGYKLIALDVLGLVKVFEDNWPAIEGKSALTKEEFEDSTQQANDLFAAVGRKEQSTPAVNEASLLRQQAYTKLVRAYAEVRDALLFVRRRRGDVDDIAPSLWAGRGKRPPSAEPAPVALATRETEPNAKVPVGFPGSDPFID